MKRINNLVEQTLKAETEFFGLLDLLWRSSPYEDDETSHHYHNLRKEAYSKLKEIAEWIREKGWNGSEEFGEYMRSHVAKMRYSRGRVTSMIPEKIKE